MNIADLIQFVTPYYAHKDSMHDLSHVWRIFHQATQLAEAYPGQAEKTLLTYGAYFHGLIQDLEEDIIEFLKAQDIPEGKIATILQVARESHKHTVPETLEGKILHDAHLIEGGESFLFVKCLVTGKERGQSLKETLSHIENNILGKFRCYLPEAQETFARGEALAWEGLQKLKAGLNGDVEYA